MLVVCASILTCRLGRGTKPSVATKDCWVYQPSLRADLMLMRSILLIYNIFLYFVLYSDIIV